MRALHAKTVNDCVPIVVFLTDGLPTVGTTQEKPLLEEIRRANQNKARVFVFGVGNDVNTRLLDTVASETRATRDYVRQNEDLEVKTSALFEKLAHPVMTDLEIVADGIVLERMVPRRLPDLFRGSHLVITGRYKGSGPVAMRLRGKTAKESKEFVYDAKFPAHKTEHDFVATLWAQRRIGQLVDILRLKGHNSELVTEAKRLGKEHGIVTPWTSQLVVEEGARLAHAGGFMLGSTRRIYTAGRRRGGEGRAQVRGGGGGPATGNVPLPAGPSSPGLRRSAPILDTGGAKLAALGKSQAVDGKKAIEANRLAMMLKSRRGLENKDVSKTRGFGSRRIGRRIFHRVGS